MPKLPGDIDAQELIKKLKVFDYTLVRQVGSHIRLSSGYMVEKHLITIPNHSPIKIGTPNSILNDIAEYLNIEKSELIEKIF